MSKMYLTSDEIAKGFIEIGIKKTSTSIKKQFLYAFMAGLLLPLVCAATNMACHKIDNIGIARTLSGVIFPAGLIMIILAGTELFTGNCLISIACLSKKVRWVDMIKNLTVVYGGNLVGSLISTAMILFSGQYNTSGGELGGYTIAIGAAKTSLDFIPAIILGILCNVLVCIAVWLSYSAKDVAGKILAMFFPIWVFVISGYEHSVANMYYIPAAILAKANPEFYRQAVEGYNISSNAIDNLTLQNMIFKNLFPVTIGNIIGGAIFVGGIYWLIHLREEK